MDIYDEECIEADAKAGRIPMDFVAHDHDLGQVQRDNFRKAVAAGVKLSLVRTPAYAHTAGCEQFAFMVQYGMTPMQAIQAATKNAADLLGHSDILGSIKPGKYADIIAVQADPLQDVHALERIRNEAGKVYKQKWRTNTNKGTAKKLTGEHRGAAVRVPRPVVRNLRESDLPADVTGQHDLDREKIVATDKA